MQSESVHWDSIPCMLGELACCMVSLVYEAGLCILGFACFVGAYTWFAGMILVCDESVHCVAVWALWGTPLYCVVIFSTVGGDCG